ncbi:hypothetical protein KSP39_PZI012503 [Platanthera zijinensis]|uniref:Uncharacterized protein n=1 Tax=Platanthera zijinensis TaxID=2320716 RepID=A0AAP0BFV0_9ASPA
MKRNRMTPQYFEDLISIHNNLRLFSRIDQKYNEAETVLWDIAAVDFESFEDICTFHMANQSLDEPILELSIMEEDEVDLLGAEIRPLPLLYHSQSYSPVARAPPPLFSISNPTIKATAPQSIFYSCLASVLITCPDNLDNLKRLAEQFQKQGSPVSAAAASAAGIAPSNQEDDDDVPELVPGDTFESAADESRTAAES